MDIYEVTAVLREAVRDEGASLAERYGADAETVAQQMIELLQERFEREGPYLSLWRDFEDAPAVEELELAGVLQMMVEADPAFEARLEGLLERFDEAANRTRDMRTLASAREEIAVQGRPPERAVDVEEVSAGGRAPEAAAGDENAYLYGNAAPDAASNLSDADE